jgi:hypothetical protein
MCKVIREFHWLLGASLRINGDIKKAEIHLNESLGRCRAINLMESEADILLEIARLMHIQNRDDDAIRIANEALIISERSGYVLQGADIHLFLSEIAIKVNRDKQLCFEHARKAKELAECQSGDYAYKVAFDEANNFLTKLRNL